MITSSAVCTSFSLLRNLARALAFTHGVDWTAMHAVGVIDVGR